jgi:Trk-type K+ transport system membrane component
VSWALFIIVLVVSFIVVRIGAIAFQLTGLEWSLAKFQALSCFTGTGFTTKEAELITGNKQRRRIASVLMVLGNAGLVIMIASFAASLNPQEAILTKLSKSFLPFLIPREIAIWVNLLIIIVVVYAVYRIFTNPKFSRKLTDFLRKKIIRKEIFKQASFEELLLATGGYGVSKIDVCSDSPILDKLLSESELRKNDITVLAIIRADKTIPNPSAGTRILLGDELLCFGQLENIRDKICFANK